MIEVPDCRNNNLTRDEFFELHEFWEDLYNEYLKLVTRVYGGLEPEDFRDSCSVRTLNAACTYYWQMLDNGSTLLHWDHYYHGGVMDLPAMYGTMLLLKINGMNRLSKRLQTTIDTNSGMTQIDIMESYGQIHVKHIFTNPLPDALGHYISAQPKAEAKNASDYDADNFPPSIIVLKPFFDELCNEGFLKIVDSSDGSKKYHITGSPKLYAYQWAWLVERILNLKAGENMPITDIQNIMKEKVRWNDTRTRNREKTERKNQDCPEYNRVLELFSMLYTKIMQTKCRVMQTTSD